VEPAGTTCRARKKAPHFALANRCPSMHNEAKRFGPSLPQYPVVFVRKDQTSMWATLALLSALSAVPSQPGTPKIINVRPTYGVFGATRADDKIRPGDIYFVSFDIEGLSVETDTGKVQYSIALEVYDSKDPKPFFKEGPINREVVLMLGGNRVSAFANVVIPPNQAAGKYT